MVFAPGDHSAFEVHLGDRARVIGRLFPGSAKRSVFSYTPEWLNDPAFFPVSPDLEPTLAAQYPKGAFFRALEDTAPDAWGERVIRRAHAKLRAQQTQQRYLAPVDFLMWVDDATRVGALRLFDPRRGEYVRAHDDTTRRIPPVVELAQALQSARALEAGTESVQDLQYLLGRGTSLGGARPKASVLDQDGWLALGKFPSQTDQRDVIRGEVLALHLAAAAGIRVASARVVTIEDKAVAVIRRFDRARGGGRLPYISAATLLQTQGRDDERAYGEIADMLLAVGADPEADLPELWRRLVFNFLICNTDDHLHNTGLLYDAVKRGWRLSPAFDLNPMPGDRRESKTWLTEDTGPIDNEAMLKAAAGRFRLDADAANAIWRDVHAAVAGWQTIALRLGMSHGDLIDFEPAFDF